VDSPAHHVLAGRRVLTPEGFVGPARLVTDGDRIAAIEPAGAVPDVTLVPGFVDLQVNGIGDVDLNGDGPVDFDAIDRALLAQGTTTWCPTLVTAPLEQYGGRLDELADARRRDGPRPAIAGAHLEGPFLGRRAGAHRSEWIRPPDLAWLAGLPPEVCLVTLGPEQPGALEAIRLLRGRGVLVALGHTEADHATVVAAEAAGARLVTHLFNAMAPLDHRRPGPAGRALASTALTVSLIADGVHVHPDVLRLAARAKGPGGWLLVTDSVAWRSSAPDHHTASRDPVDGAARLPDGTLAGSTLTMDAAVRTMVDAAGVPLAEVLAAAAATPARLLGLADRGRLAPGYRADVVALDGGLSPVATWIGGVQAWCRP
jgi:N-acetylglucosamine-6-phosphate deacetylase